MAKIRNVSKQLASMEDLLQGKGVVTQTRGKQDFDVHRIDVPFALDTEAEMVALDVTRYTRARIYSDATTFVDYIYDEAATSGIAPTVGSGFWVESVSRNVRVKDLSDFGAVYDGVTNDATALVLAVQEGKAFTVTGNTLLTLDTAQASIVLLGIDIVNFLVPTTINILGGEVTLPSRVLMSNPTFQNLTISGLDSDKVTASSVSQAGLALDHSVTFTVPSTATIDVGDYLIVQGATGTGYVKAVEGCWKVTSKTLTTVTVKITINAAWPAMTLTSASLWVMKTVLRWPNDTVGLAITSEVHTIKNVVLAGNFNVTTGSPADSAIDGLQIGSSPNTPETGFSESEQTNTGSLYLARSGVVEWEGNGNQTFGKLYGVLISACSNGWRGLQAGRNGFIGCKGSSCSGNGASGYEAEEGGYVLASNSVAAGNWQQGYFTIGGGNISCGSSFALANGTHGLEAKNFSHITADGVTSELNALFGVTTTAGQILIGSGASVDNNTSTDVVVGEGGTVNASGAAIIGSVSVDEDSNCLYITPAGDVALPFSKILENTSGGKVRLDISSIGDLNFSFDPSNTGTFTGRLRLKNSGVLHPITNGGSALGRATELYSYVYANNVVTKSPDGTLWTINVSNAGVISASLA